MLPPIVARPAESSAGRAASVALIEVAGQHSNDEVWLGGGNEHDGSRGDFARSGSPIPLHRSRELIEVDAIEINDPHEEAMDAEVVVKGKTRGMNDSGWRACVESCLANGRVLCHGNRGVRWHDVVDPQTREPDDAIGPWCQGISWSANQKTGADQYHGE
jgi:hypothetical protein